MKYISLVAILFYGFITHLFAQVKERVFTSQILIPGTYSARDNVKLSSGSSVKSFVYYGYTGSYKLTTNPNIAPPAEYGTLSSTGTPSNHTPFSTANAVGTIAGSADVNATGAATYNIPLNIPMGTAGMQPNISIAYNSQVGNGLLGKGWDLTGLSAISIVPQNNAFNYAGAKLNVAGDGYSIDGQRLILTSGTYGVATSFYSTELVTFDKISIPSDGIGFIVYTKDGKTLEYGKTADSRILGDADVSSTYVWRLNKIKDANGNYVSYEYGQESGESWVKTIDYTGNENGLEPFVKISFYYDERKDINTTYHSRGKHIQKRILSSIVISTQSTLVKKYDFAYVYNVTTSQLSEIKETGSDGISYNTTKVDWSALNHSVARDPFYKAPLFGGQESMIHQGDFDGNGITDFITISRLFNKTNRYNPRHPDKPLGFAEGSGGYNYTENNVIKASAILPDVYNFSRMYPIDVDKDGKTEILMVWQSYYNSIFNILTVKLYNLIDGVFVERTDIYGSTYAMSASFPIKWHEQAYLDLGDFDGNGKMDYIVKSADNIILDIKNFNTNVQALSAAQFMQFQNSCFAHPGSVTLVDDPHGDGFADYQCMNSMQNSVGTFDSRGTYYSILASEFGIKAVYPIDYNGDGTTELATIESGYMVIYKLTPTGIVEIKRETTIGNGGGQDPYGYTNWRNFLGDFNGDGRTDVLTYKRTNYSGNGIWELCLADNVGYRNIIPIHNLPNSLHDNFDLWGIVPGDLNNDGKIDIVLARHGLYVGLNLQLEVYMFDGSDFVKDSEGETYAGVRTNSLVESLYLMDVPEGTGTFDGKLNLIYDFVSYSNGIGEAKNGVINFHKNETAELVEKVTDGLNNETVFTYDDLASKGLYTQNGPLQSLNDVRYLPPSPLMVVVKLQVPNKPFTTKNESTFKYTGLLFHEMGRGALGFAKIERTNILKKQKVVQEMAFNNYQPYISKITTYTANDNTQLATTTTVKTLTKTGNFINLDEVNTIQTDYLQNIRTETKEEYNTDGNPEKITSNTFDAAIGGINEYTKIIENQFVKAGSYMPNVITSCTTSTHFKVDETNATIYVTKFDYDLQTGNLNNKTEFLNLTIPITVTFGDRDQYGTARSFTTTASDVPTKIIKNELDQTGRFVTKIYNTIGQFTEKTYDKVGNVLTETGIDGNSLIHCYDGFGRLKSTLVSVSGTVINREMSWETAVSGALYKVKTSAVSKPTSYTYYDATGREIRSTSETFGKNNVNKTVVVTKEYYADGTLKKESEPYYSSESPERFTDYTYDQFNRASTIQKTYLNINTITYPDYRVTNTVDQAGKVTIQKLNSVGKMVSSKNQNTEVTYKYDNLLNVKETNALGVVTKIGFDAYGRQKSLEDANAGTITYKYDSYGRLREQQDPQYSSTINYDLLDRITSKTVGDENVTYNYVSSGNGINLVQSVVSSKGSTNTYEYNNLGKVTKNTESGSGEVFASIYEYDQEGRETKHIYTTGFTTLNEYDNIGNWYKVSRIDNGHNDVIWELNELTAIGQINEYKLGTSDKVLKLEYDEADDIKSTQVLSGSAVLYKNEYGIDPNSGNMVQRIIDGNVELPQYDNLDRLYKIYYIDYTPDVTIGYKDNGNITSKTDVGDFEYGQSPHALTKVNNYTAYIPNNSQSIDYDAYGKVKTIVDGFHNFTFSYNVYHERNKMVYTNVNSIKNYTRYYAASIEKTVSATNLQYVHYINTPSGVSVVYIKDNTANNDHIFHLVKDHQGTINAILSESGDVIEKDYYDAWGRKRNYLPQTYMYSYNNITYGLLSRGYTGHEMLLEVGLINMNGRLYDPMLGRMLSPDNFIQDPSNSQSYNRYTYCFNNPLKYTDPSGNLAVIDDILIAAAIGAIISATTYTYQVATSPGGFNNWNWMAFGFQTTIGGVVGGMTFGVGEGAAQASSYLSGYMSTTSAAIITGTGQVLAHGFLQGMMNVGYGGTFLQGFASGAVSSSVSSILGSSLGDGGMVLAGALTGGVANMVSGGDFMRGFAEGLIVSALNHAVHGGSKDEFSENMGIEGGGEATNTLYNKSSNGIWYVDENATLRYLTPGENSGTYGVDGIYFNNSKNYFKVSNYLDASYYSDGNIDVPLLNKIDGGLNAGDPKYYWDAWNDNRNNYAWNSKSQRYILK